VALPHVLHRQISLVVLLLIDESHIEALSGHGQEYLEDVLSECLSEADALASVEG